jgi:DNA-binding CsgD family transcriptional regulator
MNAVALDDPAFAALPAHRLGSLVEQAGSAAFMPALLGFCRAVTGASDCSVQLRRGGEPELAGAVSNAGSRSHELFDWYLGGGFHRVEPSLQFTTGTPARLWLHALGRQDLPDSRWRERYRHVGLDQRVSLLVALDTGWAFVNGYRAPGSEVALDDALRHLGDAAPVLGAALRRHVAAAAPVAPMASAAAARWAALAARLSAREREVVDAVLGGATAKECARQLGLSPTSVATYRQRAFEKLEIRRQAQLFQLARH